MIRRARKLAPSGQADLFGLAPAPPEGLRYHADFISAAHEQELIARFATLPLAPFQFGAFEGKRRVASFGLRYDFGDRRLHDAEPLPDFILPLAARAEAVGGLPANSIRHVLFTEYETGAGIGWHRDKAAFDVVLGLSLGSSCPFRFRRKLEDGWLRYTLDAAPRSLYVMDGPARAIWEHSISPVARPRWSITFRTVKGGS